MRKVIKKRKWLRAVIAVAVLAALGIGGYAVYGNYKLSKIPALSFQEALEYTLRGNEQAVITVGVIQNGQSSYTVYGADGAVLPAAAYTYEIGSLTKTFTAALVARSIAEGKLSLDGTLDQYLPLPDTNRYPTLRQLLTHTAGYKAYYFETPMIGNFFARRNAFCGVTDAMIQNKLAQLSVSGEPAAFQYSNFGFAALGLVLESVYGEEYTALVNAFAQTTLGLPDTHIADGSGDLANYWAWEEGDAYLAAGGLTSTITDMLAYAQLQLTDTGLFAACHESLSEVNAAPDQYLKLGIRMDAIGMSWILDTENGIVWHNGGTGHYNCYLGVQPSGGTAVVILSNLAPSYRIPATVLGVKLLAELGE